MKINWWEGPPNLHSRRRFTSAHKIKNYRTGEIDRFKAGEPFPVSFEAYVPQTTNSLLLYNFLVDEHLFQPIDASLTITSYILETAAMEGKILEPEFEQILGTSEKALGEYKEKIESGVEPLGAFLFVIVNIRRSFTNDYIAGA